MSEPAGNWMRPIASPCPARLCKPLEAGAEVELPLAEVLIKLADGAFVLAFTGGGKGEVRLQRWRANLSVAWRCTVPSSVGCRYGAIETSGRRCLAVHLYFR